MPIQQINLPRNKYTQKYFLKNGLFFLIPKGIILLFKHGFLSNLSIFDQNERNPIIKNIYIF